jgi:hypothetical protein
MFSAPVADAEFTLALEPQAGFQTNVPGNPADTTFGNYPYCTMALKPRWISGIGNTMVFSLVLPLDAMKYIGGSGELTAGPQIVIQRTASVHSSAARLEATWNYTPAALDPTSPENYLETVLSLERDQRLHLPLTGNVAFALLNDLHSARHDFTGTLQLKVRSSTAARIPRYIKIGGAWKVSNAPGAGYLQPRLSCGITIPVNGSDFLITNLLAACSFHQGSTDTIATIVAGRGRWGRKTDTLTTYSFSTPRIPLVSGYLGYDHELSDRITLHPFYSLTGFGRGTSRNILISHECGLIFTWSGT